VSRAKATSTVLRFPTHAPDLADDDASRDPEAEWVARARRDDMNAWAMLYRAHHGSVFRHVLCLTGSTSAAEDLTQETFARALVALRSFGGRSSVRTWLHGIALNLVRTTYRSRERAGRAQDQLMQIQATQLVDADLDRDLARGHRTRLLYAMLDKLSVSLREAFVLRYVEGLSAGEAAAQLGIEPGTVRVRAHRARELLEAELAQIHADSDSESVR